MRKANSHRRRAAWAALAAALALGVAAPAWGQEKQIPPRILPRKDIPNEVRYRQAPSLDERQRKNRDLVNQARKERRELKPGGTASGQP
ncbi:MAG: hypothetical protein HYT99_04755 [Candidatus Tectomicrobia bacterium]|nr:hypothetical protein [Candidatus Tectomicrobia bacterium]MBI3026291.1 hypothetical protein [Candidatus Tectomicrobia bacterium]